MTRTALITGVTGQDGAYLARFLLGRGYRVVGTSRTGGRQAQCRLGYLGIAGAVEIAPFGPDSADGDALALVERVRPDEIYNLAGHSFVASSFDDPAMVARANATPAADLLRAIRLTNPAIRFYQASSSEMFGQAASSPQNEDVAFRPRNPYASAKLFSHWLTVNFRDAFGLHASSGICFNHESPIRGAEFVTRKITKGLAALRHGSGPVLELGNLDARRDWGFAGEYVEAMWRMLQAPAGGDYVIATGRAETVRRFVEHAAAVLDMPIAWEGAGLAERGLDRRTGRVLVQINAQFYRPPEAVTLVGDPTRARERLGWQACMPLAELAGAMAIADHDRIARGEDAAA